MKVFLILCTIFILTFSECAIGQQRIENIKESLNSLSHDTPGLLEKIDLTVSDLSIQEFLRNIANSNRLNLDVDNSLQIIVSNNFTDVTPIDILVFLCKQYSLDIKFTGEIMSVVKHNAPIPEPPRYVPKRASVNYDTARRKLTLDLRNDSLFRVVKEITRVTDSNVITKPEIQYQMVSVYIQDLPFAQAIDKFAFANGLLVTKSEGSYLLEKDTEPIDQEQPQKQNKKGKKKGKKNNQSNSEIEVSALSINNISLNAIDASISDIINQVSGELGINYFMIPQIKETTTLGLNNVAYSELLDYLLNGSKYTYHYENGIYLIGERQTENLRESKVVRLKFRSVAEIIKFIPSNLKKEVELFEMPELNSLIMSGSGPMIQEIEHFLNDIDEMVPVILIEVMIISYKKGYTLSTGISAGLADEPVKTGGTVIPMDITLGSSSINNLLASFNGAGMINMGRVSPNFYINLSALESRGVVKVRSTPKLSTLNGHEATMTIGNTEYYIEESSQIFANQTTTQERIRQFKPINADFNLTILPIVSGDEQITLDITVEQSDFTGTKLAPDAPPDQVKRSFKSMIRIKNDEMILLGGLDEYTKEKSGSGIPFLSRIPIIKWFFSSRKNVKSEDKLNIFIKPTVIY